MVLYRAVTNLVTPLRPLVDSVGGLRDRRGRGDRHAIQPLPLQPSDKQVGRPRRLVLLITFVARAGVHDYKVSKMSQYEASRDWSLPQYARWQSSSNLL